jgi:hypothetical protein
LHKAGILNEETKLIAFSQGKRKGWPLQKTAPSFSKK